MLWGVQEAVEAVEAVVGGEEAVLGGRASKRRLGGREAVRNAVPVQI